MKKLIMALVCSLAGSVMAANNITVVSNAPLSVLDGTNNATYTPQSGNVATSFSIATRLGHARALINVSPSQNYDVRLVSVGNVANDVVFGLWDIYRNGTLVCNACVGRMWGVVNVQGPNPMPLIISIGDAYSFNEKWRFTSTVNYRSEF